MAARTTNGKVRESVAVSEDGIPASETFGVRTHLSIPIVA